MAEKIVSLILRLPADIHSELKAWATEEDRSLNSLIVHLLRRALRERPK